MDLMTPEKLASLAVAANNAGTELTLVLPRPWKDRPPKFPRGELLCINADKSAIYSFAPLRILAWMAANKMINVGSKKP